MRSGAACACNVDHVVVKGRFRAAPLPAYARTISGARERSVVRVLYVAGVVLVPQRLAVARSPGAALLVGGALRACELGAGLVDLRG